MNSEGSPTARRFLFEYRHEGDDWALEVLARDLDDAKARLQSFASASYKGEISASGPFVLVPAAANN